MDESPLPNLSAPSNALPVLSLTHLSSTLTFDTPFIEMFLFREARATGSGSKATTFPSSPTSCEKRSVHSPTCAPTSKTVLPLPMRS